MHLLITALGSAGDVHPYLAIGQEARSRGHRVTVCTHAAFGGLVQRCGLGFRPIGSAAAYASAMADPRLWNPRTSLKRLWQVVSGLLDEQYAALGQEVRSDTVMLGSLWAFGARLLSEKQGIPYVSSHVSASTLLSAISPPTHPRVSLSTKLPLQLRRWGLRLAEHTMVDRLMGPELNRFRTHLGLAPVRRILSTWIHSPHGVLALFPAWFAPRAADWPPHLRFCGFPLFEDPDHAGLDEEVEALLDRRARPIIATAGSTLPPSHAHFEALHDVAQSLGRPLIVLGGVPEPVHPARSLAPTALHRPHLPLRALLSRSAALIHHGGVGTAAFAFQSAVPQLVTPFAHDQFDNAQRIVRLGCGQQLPPNGDAFRMQAALSFLLSDAPSNQRCRDVALLMNDLADRGSSRSASAAAVDHLEKVLAHTPTGNFAAQPLRVAA
ncbi:MAG: hypothetical protein RLZZ618_9 [Pseudomonadota bacterium]|jgi:rhamnosyltransferase subunit B